MAKEAHDREDLLRDAIAYVQRIEFDALGDDAEIFCGFRDCGAASFYFGQDRVLQFNADSELRRAFWRDRMLASYRGEMHWLDRSDGRVHLSRTPLTGSELADFQTEFQHWIGTLQANLQAALLSTSGQFPDDVDVRQRVLEWLRARTPDFSFALHPGLARAKKKP